MQVNIHRADTRGAVNHGWLQSYHTFSFASYYNSDRMGFGALRVINDDIIAPSKGFDTHPHNDMEIITVPIYGALQHKDSMGNEFVISKGEVQAMSAGSGIAHSEFNASTKDDVNLLQIWVQTKSLGIDPSYSQKVFPVKDRQNKLQLVVSPDGQANSVQINQDAYFSLANLDHGESISYSKYKSNNGLYIFVIEGEIRLLDVELSRRDGISIEHFDTLDMEVIKDAQLLFMEVPI